MTKVASLNKKVISTNLKDLFPILTWLPKYNFSKMKYDIISGLTLGMMILPSSFAYTNLSNLPAEYGLYTALTPGIVYAFFGNSKDVSLGPDVNMAMFVGRYIPSREPLQASMLTFLCGIVLLLMAIFNLGFIAKSLPQHVMAGFIGGVVVKFSLSQLSVLFGYRSNVSSAPGHIVEFFRNLEHTNLWDLGITICCIIYLGLFMWISKKELYRPKESDSTVLILVKKCLWYLCILKSSTVCILSAIVAFTLSVNGVDHNITLPGNIQQGFPQVQFPFQDIESDGNETTTVLQSVESFGSAILIIPVIQFLQALTVAKTFGKINKYNVKPAQEIRGLAMANIVNSFFGGWLVSGGFSRSAVNSATSAKTPLSTMLVMAVIPIFDFNEAIKIWKLSRIDIVPFITALVGTVYQLEFGIITGSLVSLAIMSYRQLSPKLKISENINGYVQVSFQGSPNYPCVERLKETLSTELPTDTKSLLVSMRNVNCLDYPIIMALKQSFADIRRKEVEIHFLDFENEKIKDCFVNVGIVAEVSDDTEKTYNGNEEDCINIELQDNTDPSQKFL